MRHLAWPIGMVCGLLAGAAPAAAVSALATFVSATGDNTADCSIVTPCKTLQVAHNKTDAGGVITVLSSGSFGPVKITKSISIVAQGVTALIQTFVTCSDGAVSAICINAGANDVVHLRGLTFELPAGARSVAFFSGAALHVQNCVILKNAPASGADLFATGIDFRPAGASELYVSDSTVANSSFGISVTPAANGSAKVSLVRVRVEKNDQAISFNTDNSANAKVDAIVRDSNIAGSVYNGIVVSNGSVHTNVMIDRTAVVNNGTGIITIGTGATVRIANSTVTGNAIGREAFNGAVIAAYPNNQMEGNGDDDTTALGPRRRR